MALPPRLRRTGRFWHTTGWTVASRLRWTTLDTSDVQALARTGQQVRQWITETPLPAALQQAVTDAWQVLSQEHEGAVSVAVRSSATAEDLPDASFAGQQETFLNVSTLDDVIARMHEVFASLYNDRAISYRVHQGFAHEDVALSVGVQQNGAQRYRGQRRHVFY